MKGYLYFVPIFFLLFLASPLRASEFYALKEKSIEGTALDFSNFKGKAVLVVNIASQCGFTGQLADLEKLSQKYAQKGLVILGVPSNEFGGQTPESDQAMKEFCQKKYQVSFPLLAKGEVNGKDRRPLYQFLTKNKNYADDIGWNFVKFLISPKGEVVGRWSSMTNPLSNDFQKTLAKFIP
jgi:glutathione peroxidase-family protein